MNSFLKPILLITLIGLPVGTAGLDGPAQNCPISIALERQEFAYSHEVHPRVVSEQLGKIFLPPGPDGTFRVQRWDKGSWAPASDTSRPTSTSIRHARAYDLAKPGLLGIRWEDVGEVKESGTYTVPAGRYRLALIFFFRDPSREKPGQAQWCSVVSGEFVLTKSSDWTRLE